MRDSTRFPAILANWAATLIGRGSSRCGMLAPAFSHHRRRARHPRMNRGFLATLGAFVLWGLFPLYWHELANIGAPEIMAHRIVWCGLRSEEHTSELQSHSL